MHSAWPTALLMHHVYAGKGGEQQHFFLCPKTNPMYPITTELNYGVSSSWAYVPYSPGIMYMPKDIEHNGNPKRLNNPTANDKPP